LIRSSTTPDLKEKDDFLQEVEGVGRQTAGLVGTAPYDHDSGYKRVSVPSQ
jgi:hypothetical protein